MTVKSRLWRSAFSAVVFAAASLFAVGCAPAPATEFVAQADRLHVQSLRQTALNDRDLNDYVQQVGHRIIAAAHDAAPDQTANPFFAGVAFELVASPVPNIVSSGGSQIYVYSGLFEFCESEEELAAAMCIAYAHLVDLDVERTGIKPDINRSLRADMWQFASHPFSDEQETEADRLACRIYAQAGWDRQKFENLFQRLSDKYPGDALPGRGSLTARAAQAHALGKSASSASRRPPVADRRTFASLRRQAATLAAAFPQTSEGSLFLLAFPNSLLSRELPVEQAAQDKLRPPPPAAQKLEPN